MSNIQDLQNTASQLQLGSQYSFVENGYQVDLIEDFHDYSNPLMPKVVQRVVIGNVTDALPRQVFTVAYPATPFYSAPVEPTV